jgi:MFS family permease
MLVGCAIVPVLFALRRSLVETDEFLKRAYRPSPREILRSLTGSWGLIILGAMLSTMTTVCFYLITAYTPTFGGTTLRLAPTAVQLVILCVGLSNFVWLPVMGAVSDRIGRRPILVACTIATLLTAYPALLWLTAEPSISRLLAVELWLSLMFGSYNGAMVPYLVEIMPADVRTSGFALAFSLATGIFGGFTPAICTYLIEVTGNKAVPGLWLSFAALLGLTAACLLSQRATFKVTAAQTTPARVNP